MKKWKELKFGTKYALVLSILLVLISIGVGVAPKSKTPQSITPLGNQVLHSSDINLDQLLALTNRDREDAGVQAVVRNAQLDASASAKCEDMITKDYYAHTDPQGNLWTTILQKYVPQYEAADENIDVNVTYKTARDINSIFMNSKVHHDAIINPIYTDVGFASCLGEYQGEPAVYVVEHFIERAVANKSDGQTTTSSVPVASLEVTHDIFCSQLNAEEANNLLTEYNRDSTLLISYGSEHSPWNDSNWQQDTSNYKFSLNNALRTLYNGYSATVSSEGCTPNFSSMQL